MSVRMLEPSPWYAVGNPTAIMAVVVVMTIVVVVSKTIYNVFLHPLSGFPGPPLRSAVHLINYLEEIRGYQVKNAKLLHDKYGPVVRISPDSLSFNTAQSWRDIYTVKPGKPEISKDMHFFTQSTNGLPSILVSNCQDHARIRKLVIYAFSDLALRNQEPLMVSYIDLLMKQLKKSVDGPEDGLVDLMSWYIFTTFDTIGDLCFSEPFNALQTGKYDPWMVSVLNGIKNGRFVRMQRRYPVLAGIVHLLKWISSGSAMVNVSREKHMQITQEKTQRRLDESTPRKDIVTPILQRNSVGKGMSRPEIAQTLILLVTAGSEPTAAGLSGATFNLLRNQAALACLQAEVRNAFSSADEITNHRAQQLPYLRAVIEEALRLYPPVPSRFPRRTGKGGAVIDGHFVPENVSVGTHQFATYQSSANFHNPDQFIPERWLGDAPKEYTGDVKASVQPFSMGPRNCLGKNFAYLQIRVILCKLLWHFDLELAPQSAKWNEQNAHLLWEMKPLMVKLSHRKF